MSNIKRLATALGIKDSLAFGANGYEGDVYDAHLSVEDCYDNDVITLQVIVADEAFLLDVAKFIRQKLDARIANMEGMTDEQKASIIEATK